MNAYIQFALFDDQDGEPLADPLLVPLEVAVASAGADPSTWAFGLTEFYMDDAMTGIADAMSASGDCHEFWLRVSLVNYEAYPVWFDDFRINHVRGAPSAIDPLAYVEYYPFGKVLYEYQPHEPYRYGYQGDYAEKDEETGWNSFQARMYDPVIGRWLAVDPQRQYPSPYTGMGNNPVNKVDPDGEWDFYKNEAGDVEWFDSDAETINGADGTMWENIGESYGLFNGSNFTIFYEVFGDGQFLETRPEGSVLDRSVKSISFDAVSGRPIDVHKEHKETEYTQFFPQGGSLSGGIKVETTRRYMFDYSNENQSRSFEGPTPEGLWFIEPSEYQDRVESQSFLQRAGNVFGRGLFPHGNFAWGAGRWKIYADNSTDTRGRTNMYIHGGQEPGSAGCIDCLGQVNAIRIHLNKFAKYQEKLYFHIQYPSPLRSYTLKSITYEYE